MKIKKILFYIFIYPICFLNIYGITHKYVTTDIIGGVSSTPHSIIKELTPAINFTATVKVETKTTFKNQYIDLREWKYSSPYFITVENIFAENNSSKIGRYKVRANKSQEDNNSIEFAVSGRLNFDWKKAKTTSKMIVKIGEVYTKDRNYLGDVLINLDSLNLISSIKINVLQHLNFGTVVAGASSDTRKGVGEPAIVEVYGVSGEDVKLTIPNSTSIVNSNGDSIPVNLRFRDKSESEGNNQVTVRNIVQKTKNREIGKTDKIFIDGMIKTKKNSVGEYKGTFTVRAEYDY